MKTKSLLWIAGTGLALATFMGGDSTPEIPLVHGSGKYFDGLSPKQFAGIAIIIDRMRKRGITNKFLLAGGLAVISKESSFIPQSEHGYSHNDNDYIRGIFGSRLAKYTDPQLTELKQDDRRFFDVVYAKLGGYKRIGRGFIQLTGEDNYRVYGERVGVDLLNNPEEANRMGTAADIAAAYIYFSMIKAPAARKADYHFTTINSFSSGRDAAMAAYHATAGWGKSRAAILADPGGGLKRTLARYAGFLELVKRS